MKSKIFGYSMGGYVALKASLSIPQKINRIVTLGTKFEWTPESAAREVKMLNPEIIEQKVPQFAKHLASLHGDERWKSVMDKTAQMMLTMGGGEKLTDEDLARVSVPVVVGLGEKDKMVSLDETAHAASLIPDSTLIQLPDVPHPIEQVNLDVLEAYVRTGLET